MKWFVPLAVAGETPGIKGDSWTEKILGTIQQRCERMKKFYPVITEIMLRVIKVETGGTVWHKGVLDEKKGATPYVGGGNGDSLF